MIKRSVLIGLAFILVSGVLFEWTRRQPQPLCQVFPDAEQYRTIKPQSFSSKELSTQKGMDRIIALMQTKPQDEILVEQRARLIRKLDELAASDSVDQASAKILYGPDWAFQLSRYKQLTLQREFVTMAWIGLGLLGMTILVVTLITLLIRMLLAGLAKVNEYVSTDKTASPEKVEIDPDPADIESLPKKQVKEEEKVVVTCQWPPLGTRQRSTERLSTESGFEIRDEFIDSNALFGFQFDSEDEPDFEYCLTDQASVNKPYEIETDPLLSSTSKTATATAVCPTTLEAKAEDVARQISQAQSLVQGEDVQVGFQDTLQELTEQISAIRHYASSQQDRVEKLQSGYDWNIIRTFCLRIIRSIDQLEDRIERFTGNVVITEILTEIRDELLFSLESSGVEQFDLELNSEFRGQERLAEAVKEKAACEDPHGHGRIAKIIKAGYQYIIDEDQVKIVRTAKVKLYG